jgi:prepilin-type N-terminal cleavage/methylation domain-containing protein
MKKTRIKINKTGFTLMEIIVGIAIFAIIAVGSYQVFNSSSRLVEVSRQMVTSAALANEQFEIIHNLPYSSVGLKNGIPSGNLLPEKIVKRDNTNFLVETTIRNVDDPFDGTLGGTPNDLSPADYKLVELRISVPGNPRFHPLSYTEYIAPKNLENTSTNGALFVRVFDASGQPVSEADVHIANSFSSPPISIDDITNKDGLLTIVDVPPGVNSYQVSVGKTGYSQERTYPLGAAGNPNPVKPDATVVVQSVTQISFGIDKVSTLNVRSATETCAPVGNVSFNLKGLKEIGTSPSVLKYDNNFSTDGAGIKTVDGLEWDTYNLNLTDSVYNLAGSISPINFSLAPGSVQDLKIIVLPKDPQSLLVSVRQAGTSLPLSGVSVKLTKTGFSQTLITGRGFLRQTDWSAGAGQYSFTDSGRFYDSDGNVEINDPAHEIKLKQVFGLYETSGNLTSSSFDTGSVSNFFQLGFLPMSQSPETGDDSVRLQIATNNDNTTWKFLGPDGATSTYYTAADLNMNSIHNGDRYLRYKVYFQTASSTFTPYLGEINFTFSSLCVPSGQVMFNGLEGGDYTMVVSKTGFQTSTSTVSISAPWQEQETDLMPE